VAGHQAREIRWRRYLKLVVCSGVLPGRLDPAAWQGPGSLVGGKRSLARAHPLPRVVKIGWTLEREVMVMRTLLLISACYTAAVVVAGTLVLITIIVMLEW
jgi:hypothetical protein